MKLLSTSDWQTDITNLPESTIALRELLQYAKKYKVDAIVHCGDLKERYDGISLRVVKFWARAVRTIVKAGFRFLINLGNHDRLSQSSTSRNWLDVLRAAGAETFTKPGIAAVAEGLVAFLPYTSNKQQELEWSDMLYNDKSIKVRESWKPATYPPDQPAVLVFHTEVQDMQLSSFGLKADGITPEQLHANCYNVCVGGHLHTFQWSNNVGYVGSPFTMDWGEVNEQKGHVLVTVENGKYTIKQLPTKIPKWYDSAYLEKHKLLPERGAMVRSRIDVNAKKLSLQVREEEIRLRTLFGDKVRYFVVPRVRRGDNEGVVGLAGKTDREKVQHYVRSVWPEDSRIKIRPTIEYIVQCLAQCGTQSVGQQLDFVSVEAKNWGPFEHVKASLVDQGLILLRGRNKDDILPRRSNGSGKTSLLSLIPGILYGENLNGQKDDALAHEHNELPAWGKLTMRDSAGKKIVVERRRRKHALLLKVGKDDLTSGLTGKRKKETQGLIEQFTGYNLELLKNAVYIDSTIANSFVSGTQKQRMDLVGKIENLERFEDALDIVKQDIQECTRERNTCTIDVDKYATLVDHVKAEVLSLIQIWATNDDTRVDVKAALATYKQEQAKAQELVANSEKYAAMEIRADKLQRQFREVLVTKLNKADAACKYWQKRVSQADRFISQKKCGECGQPTEKLGIKLLETLAFELKNARTTYTSLKQHVTKQEKLIDKLSARVTQYTEKVHGTNSELEYSRRAYELALSAHKEQKKQRQLVVARQAVLEKQLQDAQAYITELNKTLSRLDKKMERYQFALRALSRNGIPLYVAGALCATLNKAAEEYSELFSDSSIKLMFDVINGEFAVDVVNLNGSQTVAGQSKGESSVVGHIAAFSIRDVAPKTNLLVLDEPGSGLDPVAAKQFALGLLKLKSRWGTIIVTNHNPIISEVLAGEKIWTVTKKNRVSRLITK